MALSGIRALVFDVFGTVVDWRSTVIAECRALAARQGASGEQAGACGEASARVAQDWSQVDWAAFADAWRAGYPVAMERVRRGEWPWASIDVLHRRILDELLAGRALALAEQEAADFNRVWHRLAPWPDSVPGLLRLKRLHPVATLSNGNVSLLLAMARHAGLPWDAIFSAELFGHYKPDPQCYQGAARLLDLAPAQVLMVAAHPSDLRGAARAGLRTAYVPRPLERGPGGPMEPWTPGEFDLVACDFIDLARQLGG
jgi:2-haloacid dehalogenase